jgi:hypothetical protein
MQYRPYRCQVPTFYNLTHLKIVFLRTTNDWLGKWKWMTEVLQNCPKLQNLTIQEEVLFVDIFKEIYFIILVTFF